MGDKIKFGMKRAEAAEELVPVLLNQLVQTPLLHFSVASDFANVFTGTHHDILLQPATREPESANACRCSRAKGYGHQPHQDPGHPLEALAWALSFNQEQVAQNLKLGMEPV